MHGVTQRVVILRDPSTVEPGAERWCIESTGDLIAGQVY